MKMNEKPSDVNDAGCVGGLMCLGIWLTGYILWVVIPWTGLLD